MKIESWIFGSGVFFFVPVSLVYGFLTNWSEWVGILGILLVVSLVSMIGAYLGFTGKRVGLRPEDRSDAEIHEGAGEQGHFSPWSWWPLVLGIACATGFLGLAVGAWIIFIAGGLAIVALVGWVYEYSRGDHAH
ncbi:cytochrome c oxidase subunit 4 [Arthrobacter sp. DNA4]|uniref:cytochrome c oxidase subunit 4 n=1 Tax=Arthrobacter sp. DNA4 TaxID=2963432 RepID=UPI0020CD84E7|nr:cytochrome c oxidase subunit 4 [Arthrobacter sp. DNA4]UTT67873.1 cytochrome c oxidase subunit 4 [Arthrobacter sp. DNA4]